MSFGKMTLLFEGCYKYLNKSLKNFYGFLVSKEIVVLCRWESETNFFGFYQTS